MPNEFLKSGLNMHKHIHTTCKLEDCNLPNRQWVFLTMPSFFSTHLHENSAITQVLVCPPPPQHTHTHTHTLTHTHMHTHFSVTLIINNNNNYNWGKEKDFEYSSRRKAFIMHDIIWYDPYNFAINLIGLKLAVSLSVSTQKHLNHY